MMLVAERTVGIGDILAARDARVQKQQALISKYNHTLISFTLNIPGDIKFNEVIKEVFDNGYNAIIEEMDKRNINIVGSKRDYLFTGCEGYLVVGGKSHVVKRITINIEKNHYLGRLFDIDVISNEMVLSSRQELGAGERKCFLCKNEAKVCGRNRTHKVEELLNKIDTIINQ